MWFEKYKDESTAEGLYEYGKKHGKWLESYQENHFIGSSNLVSEKLERQLTRQVTYEFGEVQDYFESNNIGAELTDIETP